MWLGSTFSFQVILSHGIVTTKGCDNMVISRETVLRKMQAELDEAKRAGENRDRFLQHVEKLQLLCELVLDEQKKAESNVSEVALLERLTKEESVKPSSKRSVHESFRNDTMDDGTSIFDF